MSLMYNDEYEPTNSSEMGLILGELPFDLILANIKEQITDPLSTDVNYVEVIVDKCKMFKELTNDEDSIREVDEALRSLFITILNDIDNRFNLCLDLNELATYRNIVDIGEVLYEYFVLRYKKNISKFIINYINNHITELAEHYGSRGSKDVTSISYKKQFKDSNWLIIMSNLPSIINFIVNLDISPFDFVNLSAGQSNYNASVIKGLITSNRMVGDFVKPYIDISLNDHEYLYDEIQTDVRVRILKKIN